MEPATIAAIIGVSKGVLDTMGAANEWKNKREGVRAYNRQKSINDRNTRKKLAITQQYGREDFVNTDKMKLRNDEIGINQTIENRLKQLREVSTARSAGLPSGQSTDNIYRQIKGGNLKEQTAFMRDMDQKNEELIHRNIQIQQGLNLAYIDAMATIESTSYQSEPSKTGLYLGIAGGIVSGFGTAAAAGAFA